MSRNPFIYGNNEPKPRKPTNPSTLDKQAAVFAAEQNLKPWELPQGAGKPKPQKPTRLNARYRAAIGAPVSAPARQYLAATETPRRRQQYEQIIAPPPPAPPRRDTSFLHALEATPASVYHHGIEPIVHATGYAAKQATGQGTYKKQSFSQDLVDPAKALLGPALFNAVTQGQTSHLGAAGLEAAALFPPFKGLRALQFLRKGEEAAKAVEHVPDAVPAEGKQIIAGMSQATRLRREQESLRHLERGVRTAEAARALETPGEEGRIAAMAALKGPMPTLKWDRFEDFDQHAIDAMVAHIRAHPDLQGADKTFTRLNTENALLSIVHGNLPRKFEQKLLRNVFGDATDNLLAAVPFWKKAKAAALNLIGVPRTLLASFDLSAPLRQGLLFGVSHPVAWGKNFPTMVKAFKSPAVYEQTMEEIAARPTFDLMQAAKVPFTDLGSAVTGREEQFMSSYAERIPGLGRIVKASNRAYVSFLNKSRADYFDYLLEKAHKAGYDLEGPDAAKQFEGFSRLVGIATGRGVFKNDTINKALPLLNQTLFAPRLLKSRIDVFNPLYYGSLDPIARKEAFKQLAGLVGVMSGVLYLAKLAGARVNMDPRNADWAKIRIGNTRIDTAGGFQQPLRLVAQLEQGKIVSSTTGKTIDLGPGGGYGHLTRLDILARFGETKLSPPPSLVVDFFRGSDFQGKPFSWKLATYNRLTPLLAQDAIDLYREGDNTAGNIAAVAAMYGIGMFGVGFQTYGPAKPKTKGRGPSNPFISGSDTGGSNPFVGSTAATSNPFVSGP